MVHLEDAVKAGWLEFPVRLYSAQLSSRYSALPSPETSGFTMMMDVLFHQLIAANVVHEM